MGPTDNSPASTAVLDADYLVVGAGAMGMAFVDTLLVETDAHVILVDAGPQPGGHWTRAYSFVRLHQPSSYYGVNSRPLGSNGVEETGWNQGFAEMASSSEVIAYYERLLGDQFLPTGRVSYFPMANYLGDNRFRTLDGATHTVHVRRRTVDATYLLTPVPSTQPVPFAVADHTDVVPPDELPRQVGDRQHYTIVGSGKTAMDVCLWLLGHGIDPARMRWIRPRDAWMLNRANVQPAERFADQLRAGLAGQMQAVTEATCLDDLFERLEDNGTLLRLDPRVRPTMYHCAIISRAELEQLRRIRDVVRLGRIERIEPHRLVLAEGTAEADPDSLYINCTVPGLPRPPPVPVFGGDRITLQSVRGCQQVFSSALIAHVEAAYPDDGSRNGLCAPVQHPDGPLDWLRITASDNRAQLRWLSDPEMAAWLESARLNILRGLFADFPKNPRVRQKALGAMGAAIEHMNGRLTALMTESPTA